MAITGSATPDEEKDRWRTPPDLFARLNRDYGPFDLDVAADASNHLVPRWLGPGGLLGDALLVPWGDYGRRVFCNPPYSHPLLARFVRHALKSVRLGAPQVTLLIPATPEVRWFQDYVWHAERKCFRSGVDVEFLSPRVHFLRPDGTVSGGGPTGSAVITFVA